MEDRSELSEKAEESLQEYSRILTAAVINQQFRKMLLTNPEKAIEDGFGGETFTLDFEGKKRLSEIKATSLADFATQLSEVLEYQYLAHHEVEPNSFLPV